MTIRNISTFLGTRKLSSRWWLFRGANFWGRQFYECTRAVNCLGTALSTYHVDWHNPSITPKHFNSIQPDVVPVTPRAQYVHHHHLPARQLRYHKFSLLRLAHDLLLEPLGYSLILRQQLIYELLLRLFLLRNLHSILVHVPLDILAPEREVQVFEGMVVTVQIILEKFSRAMTVWFWGFGFLECFCCLFNVGVDVVRHCAGDAVSACGWSEVMLTEGWSVRHFVDFLVGWDIAWIVRFVCF